MLMSKQEKKGLVPVLRFPEFLDAVEWRQVTFRELSLDVSDGNYSSKYPRQSDFIKSGVPFLRANNLKFGTVSDEDMRFISMRQHKELAKGHLKENDILISTRGELGTVALVPDRHIGSNINAQLVRINTKNKLVNTFLFQLLDYSRTIGLIDALSTGTALKQLPIGKLNQLSLQIPEVREEQQKIADCLTSIDELVTAQTQKLDALKAHKKGLMQQLFPAEGETMPELRFPEFRDKEEWADKPLGSICSSISSGKDKNDINGIYDLYGSTGVIGKTSSDSFTGDFILAARVGANAGLLTRASGIFGVTDNTLVIFLKKSEKIDFIYYSLDRIGLNKMVFGSGQPLITGRQLKDLNISFPDPDEQQKIADCLSSVDELITAKTQKNEALKAHKKGLMQQLFPAMDEVIA